MTGIPKLMAKIGEIFSALTQMVRVGTVSSVNEKNGTVRILFGDADANGKPLLSDELPVLTRKSLRDKSYWMPDVNEHVLCLFLPFGLRQGFVLGAFYSQADAVPVADKNVMHVIFDDGSWFRYHRGEHKLSGHVVNGFADLTVDINADLKVGQDLTAHVGRDATATVGQDLNATILRNTHVTTCEDLTATVGNDATINVTEDLTATATNITAEADEKSRISAGDSIDFEAPRIKVTGNFTYEGKDGAIGTEEKRAHTDHEGSYTLTGSAVITENLRVKSLTVDEPINGTIAGA